MDRVGELVIAQARLKQLAASGSDLSIKMIAEEIERLALRPARHHDGRAHGADRLAVRPLPPPGARSVARPGKPVEFVTTGEDTELDKTMIECLADPLVHLIRNAIDHGIETPRPAPPTARRDRAGSNSPPFIPVRRCSSP